MAKLINFNKVESDALLIEGTSFQSFGYGIISQRVTKCKEISLQAKGVYAYLASCAGNDKQTYPTQSKICEDLGIKKATTLRKYITELQKEGFIKIIKTIKNSLFYRNIYLIADDTRSQEQWKKEYAEGKEFEEEILSNKKDLSVPADKPLDKVSDETSSNKNIDNIIITDNEEIIQEEICVKDNDLSEYDKARIKAIENLRCIFPNFDEMTEVNKEMRIYLELKKMGVID